MKRALAGFGLGIVVTSLVVMAVGLRLGDDTTGRAVVVKTAAAMAATGPTAQGAGGGVGTPVDPITDTEPDPGQGPPAPEADPTPDPLVLGEPSPAEGDSETASPEGPPSRAESAPLVTRPVDLGVALEESAYLSPEVPGNADLRMNDPDCCVSPWLNFVVTVQADFGANVDAAPSPVPAVLDIHLPDGVTLFAASGEGWECRSESATWPVQDLACTRTFSEENQAGLGALNLATQHFEPLYRQEFPLTGGTISSFGSMIATVSSWAPDPNPLNDVAELRAPAIPEPPPAIDPHRTDGCLYGPPIWLFAGFRWEVVDSEVVCGSSVVRALPDLLPTATPVKVEVLGEQLARTGGDSLLAEVVTGSSVLLVGFLLVLCARFAKWPASRRRSSLVEHSLRSSLEGRGVGR